MTSRDKNGIGIRLPDIGMHFAWEHGIQNPLLIPRNFIKSWVLYCSPFVKRPRTECCG